MNNPLKVMAVLGALLIAGVSFLEARTWTQSATGNKLEADFVGVEGEMALLRVANGTTHRVPIASLSIEDQKFIKENAEVAVKVTWIGEDWPRFRGDDFSNISPDTGLMNRWPSEGPEKMWTYSNAGLGYSGFSFKDGVLYTMGTDDGDVFLIAVDATSGAEIFRSEKIGADDEAGYSAGWGGGPRSTPTISGELVYCLTANGDLQAFRTEDGGKVWESHVNNLSGRSGDWGYSESPLVHDGKVIIGTGYLTGIAALNANNGSEVWRTGVNAGKAEYASVVPAEINGISQYIKLFQQEVISVKADDGTVLWRSPWEQGRTAVIPTPIVEGNQIYITSGYAAGSKLIEIDSENNPRDVWENKEMKNHHGGVVKVGDYLYGFSDGAGLICQSWETGEMEWNEKSQTLLKGSVVAAEGMLYCLNEEDGTMTLVEASPRGFESRGSFVMEPQSSRRSPQGKIWTHPVVIGGNLYLRDQEHIVCYRVKDVE